MNWFGILLLCWFFYAWGRNVGIAEGRKQALSQQGNSW